MNFNNYGVGDWLKLVANVTAAAAAGFAQGGYVGAIVTAIVAVGALLQAKPGTYSVPK